MSSTNSALAYLIAQNEVEQSELAHPEQIITFSLTPKASKKRATSNVAKGDARPIHHQAAPVVIALPMQGECNVETAAAFMQSMRDAGKRVFHLSRVIENGKPTILSHAAPTADSKEVIKVDASLVRDDMIKAIAAFIGYNMGESFGPQELTARMKAQTLLRPEPVATSVPVKLVGKGFTAGLPDHNGKTIANLQARAVSATEAMIDHEKASMDPNRSESDRELSSGMAQGERERLNQIQADLRLMGVES